MKKYKPGFYYEDESESNDGRGTDICIWFFTKTECWWLSWKGEWHLSPTNPNRYLTDVTLHPLHY